MNQEAIREHLEALRDRVDAEAEATKSSHEAVHTLELWYAQLDAGEKPLADAVIAEWILSADESKRWDALALAHDNKISSTVPALRELEARLERSDTPGAPYEAAKVNRLLGLLVVGDEVD